MADVFISYSNKDIEYARAIVNRLRKEDISVFWDQVLHVSSDFAQVIGKELETSQCIIVLWSSNSVESRWVRSEALEGFERKILVPVTVDKTKIPFPFKQIQSANFTDWEPGDPETPVMQDVLQAVLKFVGREVKVTVSQDNTAFITSNDLRYLVLSFLTEYKSWYFSPLRIKKWGGKQIKFEQLINYSTSEIRKVLKNLLKEDKVKVINSKQGNPIYKIIH